MNFKTEDTDMIVCPGCGKIVDDTPYIFQAGEDEIDITCLGCTQRMNVQVRSIPKYSSYKIDDKPID